MKMLATYLITLKMPVVILEGLGDVAAKLRTSKMPVVNSMIFEIVWPVRMGWAGHNLTDIGTGKGESEGESLDNGTCSSEPASL